jgi:1-acyl-sn-glycerol-3-phosphate acyltransferase
MIYAIAKWIARMLYRTWFRLSTTGLEHIPKTGPVIVCCNHISNWDPISLGIPLQRKIRYMAKAELFVPVIGAFVRQLGAFPVKRGGVSKDSIRTSLNVLKQGELLGIFPEGTRSRDGSGAGKRGASMLALKSGATVIPAAIRSTYKPFSRVRVMYGPAVDLSEFIADPSAENQEKATDKIMDAIRSLSRTMNGNIK